MTTGNRRPGALVGGSILVAALSSACCWLPPLAVGVRFSAVGVGAMFERYRVLLLALAAGFLVGAVVLQRRSRRACDGDTCPPPRRSGLVLPIVGGLGVVAFAVVPEVLSWTRGDEQTEAPDISEGLTATYRVTGMTCEGCASLLADYLVAQPEIRSATVNLGSDIARIEFVPGTSAPTTVVERIAEELGSYTFDPLASVAVKQDPEMVRQTHP